MSSCQGTDSRQRLYHNIAQDQNKRKFGLIQVEILNLLCGAKSKCANSVTRACAAPDMGWCWWRTLINSPPIVLMPPFLSTVPIHSRQSTHCDQNKTFEA